MEWADERKGARMSGNFGDLLNQNRGYGEAFDRREKEYEERAKSYVNRIWMKPDTSIRIVFLDDNPPIIEEHQLQIGGDWRNWFTCLRQLGESCPICDMGGKGSQPSTVGFYTVIDMSEWKDNRDKVHKNELKLLPAKFKTLQQLRKLSSKRGGLEGAMFEVTRTDSDAPNTGNMFDFEKKLTKDEILALNPEAKPFDYAEILAPKSAQEILARLKGATQASHEESMDEERIKW